MIDTGSGIGVCWWLGSEALERGAVWINIPFRPSQCAICHPALGIGKIIQNIYWIRRDYFSYLWEGKILYY